MTYLQDNIWQSVKQLAKRNGFFGDWILTIHLYYENGGNNVQIHTNIDKKNYRILRILDSNDILLIDRDDKITVEDFVIVKNSQKSFFYGSMIETEILLPTGQSLNGEQRIKIYI